MPTIAPAGSVQAALGQCSGDAEIGDTHTTFFVEKQVGGFDVAVDKAP